LHEREIQYQLAHGKLSVPEFLKLSTELRQNNKVILITNTIIRQHIIIIYLRNSQKDYNISILWVNKHLLAQGYESGETLQNKIQNPGGYNNIYE